MATRYASGSEQSRALPVGYDMKNAQGFVCSGDDVLQLKRFVE